MEKIDKVIKIIKENMIANSPGQSGGFSSSSSSEGPTAGFDLPIVDYRKKKFKRIPLFYRDLVKKISNNTKK